MFFCDASWAACREGSSQPHTLPAGKEGSSEALGRERSWQREQGGWRKAAVGCEGGGGGSVSSQPGRRLTASLEEKAFMKIF